MCVEHCCRFFLNRINSHTTDRDIHMYDGKNSQIVPGRTSLLPVNRYVPFFPSLPSAFSLKTVLRLSQVADLQKKIAAAVARLKQQQNLYEAVRSDRNVYSKNLIETQASQSPFVVRSPGPARPTRRARTKALLAFVIALHCSCLFSSNGRAVSESRSRVG